MFLQKGEMWQIERGDVMKTQTEHHLQAKECWGPQKLEEGLEQILPQPSGGSNPANTFISDF